MIVTRFHIPKKIILKKVIIDYIYLIKKQLNKIFHNNMHIIRIAHNTYHTYAQNKNIAKELEELQLFKK